MGSNPTATAIVISQEIGNGPDLWVRPVSALLGLVVAGGVEGELAQEFAGGGVDDADLQVADEHDHVGSGVGSSDADVVEVSGQAQGDDPGVVDAVVAEAFVGRGVAGVGG